jgi:hypothetical protein
MPLNAQLTLSIMAHETSSGDLSRTLRATPASYSLSLADGTGANQAQVVWSASRTAATTGESLDLRSLSDTRDGAAVTVSFTAVKAIYVRNTHATNSLLIGGSTIGGFVGLPFSSGLAAAPGGAYFFTSPSGSGFAVNGNSWIARFTGSGGSCTYDIVLIGEGTVT